MTDNKYVDIEIDLDEPTSTYITQLAQLSGTTPSQAASVLLALQVMDKDKNNNKQLEFDFNKEEKNEDLPSQ